MRWKIALITLLLVTSAAMIAAVEDTDSMKTMESTASDAKITKADAQTAAKTGIDGYALIPESAVRAVLNAKDTDENYLLVQTSAIKKEVEAVEWMGGTDSGVRTSSDTSNDCNDADADVRPERCDTDVTGEVTLEEGRELTVKYGDTDTSVAIDTVVVSAGDRVSKIFDMRPNAVSDGDSDDDTLADGTEENLQENKPRGIFGGISNAAERARTVLSGLFGSGEKPEPAAKNEGTPDAQDPDDDGDGVPSAERKGRNPQTGKEIKIPAKKTDDTNTAPVTLTAEDVGKTLNEVWNGSYTVKTGDGTLMIGWDCTVGDFHATEYYGPNTKVTRTGTTGDGHSPAPSPVSHVGRVSPAGSTTSTVSAAATWQVSSEHEDREPPAACTATIRDVQGEVEVMEYQEGGVNEKTHSVSLHSGDIQVAAYSNLADGNAAVYRLVAGKEEQTAQAGYGTIYLTDLPEGERALDAPANKSLVTTAVVRDQTVERRGQELRDADDWNAEVLAVADWLHDNTYVETLETESGEHEIMVRVTDDTEPLDDDADGDGYGDAEASDPDGTVESYEWRIDGEPVGIATPSNTSTTTDADGTETTTVTLTLTDVHGTQMNKAELIDAIAADSGLSKADAKRALNAFIDTTTKAYAEGREGNGGIDIGIKTKT